MKRDDKERRYLQKEGKTKEIKRNRKKKSWENKRNIDKRSEQEKEKC